jgi:hypothetical protein
MSLPDPIRNEILELNPFHLANEISIASPDSPNSPGALFLSRIVASTIEAIDYLDVDDLFDLVSAMDDNIHEIADNAPSIYTADRWAQFTDLAAWNEEIDNFGKINAENLTDSVAGVALYSIARRLTYRVTEMIAESLDTAVTAAMEYATDLGTEHGKNAASWFEIDDAATAASIAQRIADGDPEIMDNLPRADLSGQFADGVTVASILADTDLAGLDPACHVGGEIGDTYTEAFNAAAENEIVATCKRMLSDG